MSRNNPTHLRDRQETSYLHSYISLVFDLSQFSTTSCSTVHNQLNTQASSDRETQTIEIRTLLYKTNEVEKSQSVNYFHLSRTHEIENASRSYSPKFQS